MPDEYIRFPLLDSDGRNWAMYKKRFYLSAVSRGLKGHLTGTKPKPKDDDPDFDAWEIAEASLKYRLASMTPSSIYAQIETFDTVKEAYDELTRLFEHRHLLHIVDLRRKLVRARFQEGGDLRSHFAAMKTMREDLAASGKGFTDSDFIIMLLASLPVSYDGLISSAAGSMECTITPTQLIQEVLGEHDRRSAITAKRSDGKSRDQVLLTYDYRESGKVECLNCKKKGHRKADCRAKGRGKEEQGLKKKTTASARAWTLSASVLENGA